MPNKKSVIMWMIQAVGIVLVINALHLDWHHWEFYSFIFGFSLVVITLENSDV